ncbi:hypothetical protein [Candidatus Trichorickettsia mobilis]|uniref:hypothetical protein n=1 Tax=Candidatus Trichorickettsia mobilis TaxID=1346319 RepID=UPI00292DB7A3|nr:hypothetical protein [Candidatus Trichorickettsia mobilis]
MKKEYYDDNYYDDNYVNNVEEKQEVVITLHGIDQYLQAHQHEDIKQKLSSISIIPTSANDFTRTLTAHKTDPRFIQNLRADEALDLVVESILFGGDEALDLIIESTLVGEEVIIPLAQSIFE